MSYGVHVAYLDPMVGAGLLICPNPDDDIEPPGGSFGELRWVPEIQMEAYEQHLSLHWADWERAIRSLLDMHWTVLEDEWGMPLEDGATPDGRTAVSLYGEAPVISQPTLEEIEDSLIRLRQAAGISNA